MAAQDVYWKDIKRILISWWCFYFFFFLVVFFSCFLGCISRQLISSLGGSFFITCYFWKFFAVICCKSFDGISLRFGKINFKRILRIWSRAEIFCWKIEGKLSVLMEICLKNYLRGGHSACDDVSLRIIARKKNLGHQ